MHVLWRDHSPLPLPQTPFSQRLERAIWSSESGVSTSTWKLVKQQCHSQWDRIAQSWTWRRQGIFIQKGHTIHIPVKMETVKTCRSVYGEHEPRENSINTMSVDDLVKLDKVTIMLHQKRHVNRQTNLSRGRQRYKQNIAETTKVKPRAKR